MVENNDKNQNADEVRNDGGLITGATLVGGTKLVYEASKDLYSWFKPEQKIFIQLLDSFYIDNYHLVKARFASGYIHGVHIESIGLKNKDSTQIQIFRINPGDNFGWGKKEIDSNDRIVNFPYLILPNGNVNLYLKIPNQDEPKIVNENGVNLVCAFSPIDKLGDTEYISTCIRLRWE